MESTPTERYPAGLRQGCGRRDCTCSLPLSERFVLWAVRQWQSDRALPTEGSTLHQGFKTAGLLDALADFAIAMDALFFGVRRSLEIHRPTCVTLSGDEATLLALCTMAQIDCDGPLAASLEIMMLPAASRVTGARLKAFAAALSAAGLRLAPPASDAQRRLH
jgi:hypothetical protein